MKILPAQSMRLAEQAAVDAGGSFEELMENAGTAAARILLDRSEAGGKPVLILCGKGNNGGDGLVIARKLAEAGRKVRVIWLLGQKLSPLSQLNRERLTGLPVSFADAAEISDTEREQFCTEAGLIVDGCFGTGFSGELRGLCREWMAAANRSGAFRAALDIPTGMNCDNGFCSPDTFRADLTITFAADKPAHFLKNAAPLCGEVRCAEIGIPAEIIESVPGGITLLERETAARCIPARRPDSNKGDYGRLLTVGGSDSMTGAILMASSAAMRCGAGLVKAAIPASAVGIFGSTLPEAIYCPLQTGASGSIAAEEAGRLEQESGWATAILAGCGMGVSEDSRALLQILFRMGKPMVLDADALNCLAENPALLLSAKAPVILTPHMKEFSRLCGLEIPAIKADRFRTAADFAAKYRVTLILKDSNTVIAAPDGRLWMNRNGNSGMAKAGSGDVLAGMTASFLAQAAPPEQAALAAVFLHGDAGDLAAEELTPYCMTATDLIRKLPAAFRRTTA